MNAAEPAFFKLLKNCVERSSVSVGITSKPSISRRPCAKLVPDPEVPKKLKLLWLACGNKDGLLRVSQGVHAYPKEKGVPHVWNVDGNAHDTPEWQNNLYHFSQKLFQ